MSTLAIILVAIGVLMALLAVGGFIVVRRRMEATETEFRGQVEQANHDLAAAHAADKGWDPRRLADAARRVFGEHHPDRLITTIALVQVIDNPGTEEDAAVFHVKAADGSEHTVALLRRGDDWVADEREGKAVVQIGA